MSGKGQSVTINEVRALGYLEHISHDSEDT